MSSNQTTPAPKTMHEWVASLPRVAVTCPFSGTVREGRLQRRESKWAVIFWDSPESWTSTRVLATTVAAL